MISHVRGTKDGIVTVKYVKQIILSHQPHHDGDRMEVMTLPLGILI